MLGGRTNHYGRISLRMGPYDFKPYSRDGKGFDWPITYEDLAPYYDKAEELIGVFGTKEGLENTPDGKFQPAPAPRGYERVDQSRLRQAEYSLHSFAPRDSDTSAEWPPGLSLLRRSAAAPAARTPTLTPPGHIFPGHEDRQSGSADKRYGAGSIGRRATAWRLASPMSTKRREKKWKCAAKIVVLAASCCETARHSAQLEERASFPMALPTRLDWSAATLWILSGPPLAGIPPCWKICPPQNEDGVGGMHLYMPWWVYKEQKANKMPFARGYHIEIGGGRDHAGRGSWVVPERLT